jgi:PAS domain S-box-containing protein
MSAKTTRFEHLLEAVPDALVGMDQKGVIRFVNRQTESLFGYDRDQLIGQGVETLVPESLWQIYAEHRNDYFADPRTRSSGLEVELIGRHRDGSELPINISLSSIDTGDVLLVITAVRDVTHRQQAVRNAQHTAAMVEYSDDAIIGMALDGRISSWNPAAERMYGYSSNEIIGSSGTLLRPEDRAGELTAILARIKDGQYVEHSETTLVRKDGTVVPVSITAAPIRDEDGVIIGASAVHRDVTELRLAYERAQRMAAIVDGSDDAIIGSTLDGIITSWNAAAERLFGYSSEEIIGKPADFLTPKDRPDEVKAIMAKNRAGQHVEHLHTVRVRRDGTAFPVSLTVSPIRGADGTIVGTSMINRDMTELHHAVLYSRSLIEAALDPLVTISAAGKIDDVNEATVKVTGIPRDKLIGTDFSHYFTEPDKAHQGYQEAFAQGSVTGYPLTLRHQDGTLTDVLYNASVYRDFNGEVLGVLAVARDVTEQVKVAEVAQSMAAIVRYSEDAIVSRGLDDAITSWNPAAERIFGYSSEEIIGKPAALLTPEDRVGELEAIGAKVRAGQPVERLETTRVHKDGTLVPVSLTVSPILDEKGSIVGASTIARDMTEQKRALEAAQRMMAIVESSDDAIIGRTIDGTVTSWNPAAERMLGYSGQEIVGKHFDVLIPEDRAAETISILAKISAGRPVHDFETIRVRKDGTAFPVSLTISPIRDESGAVVSASVICRDVTELKHAARYARSLIEAALDPLVTISPEGKIDDVNEATVKATGVPRGRLIGTDFSHYFTDPDKADEGYQRVFAQGSVTDYPLTLRHQDGTLTDVLYNASVYRDEGGKVLGVFAAARDMTRQKEGFEAAQRIAAIVEHSDDAIIGNTLDGIITSWNPAAERMFGYSGEEIIGKSGGILSPKDRTDEVMALLAKIREGRPVDNFETICARKDGTTFPIKLTAAPIRDVGGGVVGASVIVRDVYAIARDVTGQK